MVSLKKFDLTNKIALITGAAGLLGVEHSFALLESGATVLLTDSNQSALDAASAELEKNFNRGLFRAIHMDVTDAGSINSTATEIYSFAKRIDILINNAAIDPKVKSNAQNTLDSRLEKFPLNHWNQEIAVGLTGAFLCSQIFGSAMAFDKKGGVILNIASDLSVIAPDQRLYRSTNLREDLQPVKPVTYSVIKSGLIGLTRYLATYWADVGIRCNALSPGGVFADQNEEFVHRLSQLIPLGRMAYREEYRSAVQFLCSDASSYLTGQNIVMDGGRSVW